LFNVTATAEKSRRRIKLGDKRQIYAIFLRISLRQRIWW